MRDSHLILDCDGVLLDWTGRFAEWMYWTHRLPISPVGPCSYDMKIWTGAKSDDQVREWVEDFNHSEHFARLRPCRRAVQGIQMAVQAGAKVSVVTSCGDHPKVHEARRENLKRVFGDVFHSIECLGLGQSKIEALSQFSTDRPTFWVEDHMGHAINGMLVGHNTYMIRHKHNRFQEPGTPPGIKWVDTLADAVSHAQEITENVNV